LETRRRNGHRHGHRRPRSVGRLALATLLGALLLILAAALTDAFSNAGRASTLTSSDGYTSLSTLSSESVTPGPYTSGQKIKIVVEANSVISAADLPPSVTNTGHYYVEECADPNEVSPSTVITGPDDCEALTVNDSASRNQNSTGGFTVASYPIYDLPDPNFPSGTLSGSCDVAPNTCVLGIFVLDPSDASAFTAPHLFSAPFNVTVGDGMDLGDNPGDGSAPAVASTSAANSTVNASSPSAVADGEESDTITIKLRDTNDNPVTSGKQVSLTQSPGASSVISTGGAQTATATTDGSGQAVFSVTDLVAESVTYTATDVTDGDLQVTAQASVQFDAPSPSGTDSTMSANPTTVAAANGTDSSVVTVTLNDQAGEPIAHKLITLSPASGDSVVNPTAVGSDTTDAQGEATFAVTDTTDETVIYTATDATDHVALTGPSATVTFGTLSVSAGTSTVTTATPLVSTQLTNGGQLPTGQVKVTLISADGLSHVSGKTVSLSASSPHAIVSPSSLVTGSDGSATFSVSDGTDEGVTFNAEDTTDTVAIAATAQVTFEAPQASAATSELLATSAPVPADGVTAAPITVTIRDQFGGPVAGVTVTIAALETATGQPSTTTRVAPSTTSGDVQVTTTDGNGSITFDAYDTTAESVTFTATDTTDGVVVAQTGVATFTAGAPQVDQSSLQANPTAVPADGSTASVVTVTLQDHNDNPIPGLTITLSALDGSSSIVASSPVTDAAGVATFKVTDSTAEIVTYRATDTTDDLPLVGQEISITFGSPKPDTPVVADSAILSNSSVVPADGTSTATISVILNDANGLPVAGKAVKVSPTSGSSTVTPGSGTTDADGTAMFTVSDRLPETVNYTATDTTDGVALTGLSATVTFSVAPASSAQSSSRHLNAPVVGMAADPDGKGYWLVASDGGVFTEGDAGFYGSAGGIHLNKPVVGMAATPDGKGYWLVASDGGIFGYGDAGFYGSAGGIHLNKPVVGMAVTPNGGGYWLVASDGGIFGYGDAGFYGSAGGIHLNKPVVGMAATPDGGGYWLVASDGGVFGYGDGVFYGSTGGMHLNQPVVGMAASSDGRGYWLVASDGGVFGYGDASFYGSAGGIHLNEPVVGTAASSDGGGYWMVASDGGIFGYGDAVFYGSMAG
jgi:hypothetical protein